MGQVNVFFVKNFFDPLWVPYAVKSFFLVIVRGKQCVCAAPTHTKK